MDKDYLFKASAALLVFFNLFFLGAVISSQVILKGETVSVPELVGKTLSAARAELARKDLNLSHRGSDFSEIHDKGLVISQDPAAHSSIRVTGTVRVVTSSGSRSVKVPALLEKSLEQSMTLLQEAGLVRGYISQIHSGRFPAGRIIDQKPDPEVMVERNAPVNLLISQGGQDHWYIMPRLLERRSDRVIGLLKKDGFQVADLHYVYYPGITSGIIVGQDPPFGYRIQKRSRISLEVSR